MACSGCGNVLLVISVVGGKDENRIDGGSEGAVQLLSQRERGRADSAWRGRKSHFRFGKSMRKRVGRRRSGGADLEVD